MNAGNEENPDLLAAMDEVLAVDRIASQMRAMLQMGTESSRVELMWQRANELGWGDVLGTDRFVKLTPDELALALTRALDDEYWPNS